MSTVKSKKLQVGTDATASNNFTIYQPSTPDGTLRVGVGNADSPTEVGRFDSNGYVATNVPAFAVGLSADQSISSSTYTKCNLNTEDFDTTNNFDSSTNYRFQPTIAGYYQINATMRFEGTNMINNTVAIYKNGSQARILGTNRVTVSSPVTISGGHVIYLNGTTDYIELYGYVSGTSLVFGVAGTVNNCHLSGSLIKAA